MYFLFELAAGCSSLSHPANGYVNTSAGTEINATAYYSCEVGFYLTGNASLTCLTSGKWEDSAPECLPVDCGELVNPRNGHVATDAGTTYGEVAVYTCQSGFVVNGSNEQICLETGNWSTPVPECERLGK